MDKINLGLIGCGRAAELIYMPLLRNIPSVKVTAVADPIDERRALLALKFRDCSGFPEIARDFLNRIDAAIVTTPPDNHVPLASVLLKHNKFVLVEKPLALSTEGIIELIETERNSQAKLMMGFNHRYWLPALRLREKISKQTKMISAQIIFTGDYSKWNPVSFISDPVDDLGPHVFDLIRFILQKEIVSVKAESAGEKSVNIKIKVYPDSIIDCRIAHSDKTRKTFNISTQNGNYTAELGSERVTPEPGFKRRILDLKDKAERKILRKSSPVKRSFAIQLETFFNLIKANKVDCAGIEEGLKAILSVNAVSESLKNNGKEICFDEIK